MLRALTVKDVAVIESCSITFGPGLSVMTGETGAGKSLLVDAIGLALGGRADSDLVRAGARKAVVSLSASVSGSSLAVFAYIRHVLAKNKSHVLQGETAHLLSDTLASLGVLVGLIVYSVTLWQPLDPLIAIVFTLVGAAFAIRQLKKVLHPLMDGALPEREVAKIEEILNDHPEVRGYHRVQTRETGRERVVDIHVLLDDDLTFVKAHDLAEHLEDHLSQALGGAKVTLHYEPAEAELEHRRLEHGEPRPN